MAVNPILRDSDGRTDDSMRRPSDNTGRMRPSLEQGTPFAVRPRAAGRHAEESHDQIERLPWLRPVVLECRADQAAAKPGMLVADHPLRPGQRPVADREFPGLRDATGRLRPVIRERTHRLPRDSQYARRQGSRRGLHPPLSPTPSWTRFDMPATPLRVWQALHRAGC